MYYDINSKTLLYYADILAKGIEAESESVLNAYGIYKAIKKEADITSTELEYVYFKRVYHVPDENVYVVEYGAQAYSVKKLMDLLPPKKQELVQRFIAAFAEIDARTRPMRGALLSVIDGTFPTQAYNADEPQKDLTPEQQQRIVDVGIMWELEEVAQANRDMQTELLALEITEDMTLEQAQEITLRIANAQPWLPWRE